MFRVIAEGRFEWNVGLGDAWRPVEIDRVREAIRGQYRDIDGVIASMVRDGRTVDTRYVRFRYRPPA